jgi:hypothetical protein
MMVLGLGHGVVGVVVRPTVGVLEMIAKSTAGMGLICLGSRAISGSTLRRVRAPGALLDDSLEVRPSPSMVRPLPCFPRAGLLARSSWSSGCAVHALLRVVLASKATHKHCRLTN